MKILAVNKFHFPKGGADVYFLDLCKGLEERGYDVARFCMDHPKNTPSKWSQYFVSRVDYNQRGILNKLKGALRIFYSFEAKRKFRNLVDDFQPDIIHIHNIYHQISPSILDVAKKARIPVIMHLHDYKLVSPNYSLFHDGLIYERCLGKKYYRCILDKCFKNSYLKSVLVTLEMYLHHTLLQIYEKNVSMYIAPSDFMASMLKKTIPSIQERVCVVSNPVDSNYFIPAENPTRDYFLVYGRLVQEKGFDIVLRAYAQLSNKSKKLLVVGDGPERASLRELAQELEIESYVDFKGVIHGKELVEVIQNAFSVIVPSRWYEVFGLTNIEAMACGRPVIASRIGGIPDVVKDEGVGLLFEPENVQQLRDAMMFFVEDSEKVEVLGKEVRRYVESRFPRKRHIQRITDLYKGIISKSSN